MYEPDVYETDEEFEQALQVAGPIHEIYHVGPRDTDDSSRWRTEIGWPIFYAAARAAHLDGPVQDRPS